MANESRLWETLKRRIMPHTCADFGTRSPISAPHAAARGPTRSLIISSSAQTGRDSRGFTKALAASSKVKQTQK